jgi:hypothetical protein
VLEDGAWRFHFATWNMYYIGPTDLSMKFLRRARIRAAAGVSSGPDDPTTVRTDFLFTSADGKASAEP